MLFKTPKKFLSLFFSAAFLFLSSSNAYGQIIVNGGFETGDFTGWGTMTQNANGEWVVYSQTDLPLPFSDNNFYAPPFGIYAAAADMFDQSSMILFQDITLPTGSWVLQFTYFYVNYAKDFSNPTNLSPSGKGNQQFRVDIVNPNAADPYSVLPADVLQNLISTPSGTPLSQAPTTVSFDISSNAGQTIRLRFAAVENEEILNLGIDGVSIFLGLPPSNLQAQKITNRFLLQTNQVVQLKWLASQNPSVISYHIYQNGLLIGTVPASGPLIFNAPLQKNVTTVYGITGYDNAGNETIPATINYP